MKSNPSSTHWEQASQSTSHDYLAKSLPLPMGSTSLAVLSSRIYTKCHLHCASYCDNFSYRSMVRNWVNSQDEIVPHTFHFSAT